MRYRICPRCKAKLSGKNQYCWKCGCLLKNSWAGMRKGFGITDLVIGTLFMCLILGSEGGIGNNTRMCVVSWFFIWCGLLDTFGYQRRWAIAASIPFYVLGIIFNFVFMFEYPTHILLMGIMTVFLTFICISFTDKESFKEGTVH